VAERRVFMTAKQIKDRITAAFKKYITADDDASFDIVPKSLSAGKLYEAYALALIAQKLAEVEGYTLKLVNSNYISLKSAPGPINRAYPFIQLLKGSNCVAEMWTDVEFLSMSHSISGKPVTKGDYHELDIVIVDPSTTGRPPHSSVWLAAECKNTGYTKGFLKEILGIRRELSLLQDPQRTKFAKWPRNIIPANPPSCLLVFATDISVNEYAGPGNVFGIDFYSAPIDI
jgi:hypothetical protein